EVPEGIPAPEILQGQIAFRMVIAEVELAAGTTGHDVRPEGVPPGIAVAGARIAVRPDPVARVSRLVGRHHPGPVELRGTPYIAPRLVKGVAEISLVELEGKTRELRGLSHHLEVARPVV